MALVLTLTDEINVEFQLRAEDVMDEKAGMDGERAAEDLLREVELDEGEGTPEMKEGDLEAEVLDAEVEFFDDGEGTPEIKEGDLQAEEDEGEDEAEDALEETGTLLADDDCDDG
jgi:hypothetical protein